MEHTIDAPNSISSPGMSFIHQHNWLNFFILYKLDHNKKFQFLIPNDFASIFRVFNPLLHSANSSPSVVYLFIVFDRVCGAFFFRVLADEKFPLHLDSKKQMLCRRFFQEGSVNIILQSHRDCMYK